jgi:hypothetical protein
MNRIPIATIMLKKHLLLVGIGLLSGIGFYLYLRYDGLEDSSDLTDFFWIGIAGILVAQLINLTSRWLDQLISWTKSPGIRLLIGLIGQTFAVMALLVVVLLFYSYFKENASKLIEDTQLLTKHMLLVFILLLI